MEKTS